jgi:serine/threonine-protein kinase
MGLWDKFQTLLKSDKVDVKMRFDLLSEGLAGTMSKFHKARDRKLDRVVGLKLCDPEKTELFEARFRGLNKPTEGEIGASLHHERIVETLEHGVTSEGQNYIVMEFVDGPGMHTLVRKRESRLVGQRLELIRQMAQAIQAVHDTGYIHRDVCPRNFIAAPDLQTVKLIDFGLTLPDKPAYRQPGNRTGTPMYMSPEIVRRRNTDHRVDIFAFGVTCYHILTYELPWPNTDYTGKGALAHDTEEHVPILELLPKLHKTLAAAVTDCMAPDRENRPDSLDLFLQRIRKVKSEEE